MCFNLEMKLSSFILRDFSGRNIFEIYIINTFYLAQNEFTLSTDTRHTIS